MYKRLLAILLLIPLLLAACTGAEEVTTEPLPSATAEKQAAGVDEDAAAAEVEEAEPTEAAAPEPTATSSSSQASMGPELDGPQMECTTVGGLQEAPPEYEAIFGVTDSDWVNGPETAAMTIVEYSDFQ